MNKTTAFLSFLLLATLSGCSKWAGDPITQTFNIDGTYTELEVHDAFDVTVSDLADQVTVTVGENVMPYVVVKEDDNKLQIYLKGWHSNRGSDMKVILPYNAALTSVDLSGASEFTSAFGLKGTEVEVELSGSSDFEADIEADDVVMELSGASDIKGLVAATNLSIDMSGSSDANLQGQVSKLTIDFSGSSTLKKNIIGSQYAIACTECEGDMSGASDAYIHCDGRIKMSLSGSSDLHYTGRASTTDCSTSGSSNIIHDVL